ncbi:MAG: response regulator transcription factor [Solirubrobacterales bacterium]|jgi:DNA-binding NarL/FixJ family response regulator|nr:response regulator transcription factor [Solirubrobacterales bacterium]
MDDAPVTGGPRRRRFGFRRAPAAGPTDPPVRTGPATLLLVDDIESIRVLLRTTLEPEFSVAGEAGDGREAATLAEALQPDIVLLDLNMPRFDGLEAIAPIRRTCPATRIVVFSGLPPELLEDKAMQLGAHRFVDKARPLAELPAILREVLDGD